MNRHSRHCGSNLLSCYNCPGSTFKDPESLQTHCRRKHNSTMSFVVQPSNRTAATPGVVVTNYTLSTAMMTSSMASSSSSRTACPGQLSAALAMAELSSAQWVTF